MRHARLYAGHPRLTLCMKEVDGRDKPGHDEAEMTSAKQRKANRERAAAHRARMRAEGLRRIELWVPDTRSPEFAKEARRQMRALARSPQEKEDIAFVESISW